MLSVADETGMQPARLGLRIKSKASYLRKIEANYNPNGTQYEVKDILRYTLTADSKNLSEKTLSAVDNLSQKGVNTSEIKNYWLNKNEPYNGINILKDKTGVEALKLRDEMFDLSDKLTIPLNIERVNKS